MQPSDRKPEATPPMIRRSRTVGRAAIGAIAVVLIAVPVIALAHGGYGAIANQPNFNERTLRLVGRGGYVTEKRHQAVRVVVCLQKRYGSRFFRVRCKTATDGDRGVRGRVSVPGCVEGDWRTTAVGQAFGRGKWKHTDREISSAMRCR